jgi:hypothetical protein
MKFRRVRKAAMGRGRMNGRNKIETSSRVSKSEDLKRMDGGRLGGALSSLFFPFRNFQVSKERMLSIYRSKLLATFSPVNG